MLACAFDDVGGRDFDLLLANHFAQEFKSKYKVSFVTYLLGHLTTFY